MPSSSSRRRAAGGDAGRRVAVAAEALYLANLLILPGLAFVALVVLFWRRRREAPPLAAAHLDQALSGSLWAGVILVVVNGLIVAFGGYSGASLWVIVVLYFTVCHAALVLCGAMGLARAIAGQYFRYPLVGRPLPAGA